MIILSALFAFIAFVAGYAEHLLDWEVRGNFEAGCVITIFVSVILAIVFLCRGIARHTGKKPEGKEPEGTEIVAVPEENAQKLPLNVDELSPQQCVDLLNAIMERSAWESLMDQMMARTAETEELSADAEMKR